MVLVVVVVVVVNAVAVADEMRSYTIARASALEWAAILGAMEALRAVDSKDLESSASFRNASCPYSRSSASVERVVSDSDSVHDDVNVYDHVPQQLSEHFDYFCGSP